MRVDGRCHCGAIRYLAEVDPAHVTICHCTDCQRLSGTGYRIGVPAPAATFELEGKPSTYVKTADSGNKRVHAFCADCGSPIYSSSTDPEPPTYSLRVGGLDERESLPPQKQIWRTSAMDWADDLRDVPKVERQ